MEKQKMFTYYRHGVAYKMPIPEGMTRQMMAWIYSEHSGTPFSGALPVSYENAPTFKFIQVNSNT